jgi:RimJ/RimL family protein N-acetyltransferase
VDTARLAGRPLTPADLAFLERVWNDERVAPTIGGPRDRGALRARIDQWTRHREQHGFGATVFSRRTTGDPIGWGGLQHSTIGVGDRLTVGYVIAPEAWGHGYATEIAVAAVAHAFEVLGADEVHASVLATNAASRRVLEKAGLAVVAEIDHGSHVEVVYRTARPGAPGSGSQGSG